MKLKVGSRTSLLAMTQTQIAMDYMKKLIPDLEWEIVGIVSKGDEDQQTSLRQLGGEGVFVRKLEEALLNKEIDIAIHSAKDVPTLLHPSCVLAATLPRENPKDLLILDASYQGFSSLKKLPNHLRIGTGSLRRQSQLRRAMPTAKWIDIRGNVDTRLKKVGTELDGIVLAKAGINRLGMDQIEKYHVIEIPIHQCLPAPGQGFLVVEALSCNHELLQLLHHVSDIWAERQLSCERAFLETLGLDCRHPLAIYVRGQESLSLDAYLSKDAICEGVHLSGEDADPIGLGREAAMYIRQQLKI